MPPETNFGANLSTKASEKIGTYHIVVTFCIVMYCC